MHNFRVLLAVVAASSSSLFGADLLYTTGEPTPITDIATQTQTNGGYISGFFDATLPQRWTATALTLETAVNLEEGVFYWFDSEDNSTLPIYNQLEWVFYADDVGGGPGTIVASGIVQRNQIINEDWIEPVGLTTTDWKRRLAMVTTLEPGTYWLSVHGLNGAVGWLTGAIDGSDIMYRATVGTDYSAYTNTIWETPDDPGRVYHVAFELYGTTDSEPECEGDANGDNVVDPLDSGYVLSRFGCPVGTGDPTCDAADQNLDGVVDPLDAGFVLSRFGECPAGILADDTPVEGRTIIDNPTDQGSIVPAID